MPPSLDDLDKRVRSLEIKMSVAIALGVILGLGGAAIGTMLASAGRDAKALQESLDTMKSDIPKLLKEPTEGAKGELKRYVDQQRLALESGLFAAVIGGDGGVALQKPEWLTGAATKDRAGKYVVHIRSGTFRAPPICTCSSVNLRSTSCTVQSLSSTSVEIHTIFERDLVDDPFSLICANSQ